MMMIMTMMIGSHGHVPLLSVAVAVRAAVETSQIVANDAAVARERDAVASLTTQRRVRHDDQQLTSTRLNQSTHPHRLTRPSLHTTTLINS